MKKIGSVYLTLLVITTLSACQKRSSLQGGEPSEMFSQSAFENSSAPAEIIEDIELQKISELRGDLDRQIESIKNADYENLHAPDNFTVKLPETDELYELELTHPELAWHDYYDKFDRIFDRDFGDIYSPEDKPGLYLAAAESDNLYAQNHGKIPLAERRDKFESGELEFNWLYVRTNKAYLEMYPFGNGIFRLYRDGVIKRAESDKEHNEVLFTDAERYFNIVKNSLDVDSDEKYALLDKEMSVKDAAEEVKRLVSENEYSYGGSLDPDVYEVRIHDIGEGKYGFTFMMTPSYKGVLFDVYDTFGEYDGWSGSVTSKLDHSYDFSPAKAFIMESGKLETFCYGGNAYTAEETAVHDSVIPLDTAVRIASEKFGAEMNLTLVRAELLYSPRYYIDESNNEMGAFPVWKLKCSNTVDSFKYIVYVNAINGELEYYIADGWVI